MKRSNIILAAAAILLSAFAGGNAFADSNSADWHAFQPRRAIPPLGFQLFCLKNPKQCRAAGKGFVHADAQMMQTLMSVNSSVNRSIIPRDGAAQLVWNVDPTFGNCHDFAMTKRSHLIEAGVPASALRIAYVKTSWGEGHAVLVVRTDGGEYVLDNLTSAVLPIQKTNLHFISMSGANPTQWFKS